MDDNSSMEFQDWLVQVMKMCDISQADLARFSGLTTGAISNYIQGRIPAQSALKAIARALKLPPEEVYRAAGLLPPNSENSPNVDELDYLAKQLTDDDVQDLIGLARVKLKRYERAKSTVRKP